MKLLLYVFAAFWSILPSVFSQTPMPAQTPNLPISAQIQRAINLLSGAGWADAQKLASERETLATALPGIIAADMRSAHIIAEKTSSSDLLMQSIYQGLLTATDRGIDCKDILPKFFEKVLKSSDPADIPDRSRFWVVREAMLLNLAIRIVRSVERRELTADEVAEIADDPSGWIKRVYPTRNGVATSPAPGSDDVKTTSLLSSTDEQVAPPVQPPAPKKAPESKPSSTQSEEPWSIIVVLIVVATGLLWLLLKRPNP
jgi:hypothetical protein